MEEILPGVNYMSSGIREYGVFVMIAAVFLCAFIILFISQNRQQNKMVNQQNNMIDQIFNKQQSTIDSILELLKVQGSSITQMKEALTGENISQVRVLIFYALEYNKHAICTTVIGQIKEKNGIENKGTVEKNVRSILMNLYKKLTTDIDEFQYYRRKLSEYFSEEWVERVYAFCMESIYDGKEYHREPYLRGLDILFEAIKIEFFENIKRI